VKCSICDRHCGYGALCLSIITDEIDTVNLCYHCRAKLFGSEVDERVRRLVRLKGWVQVRLPV